MMRMKTLTIIQRLLLINLILISIFGCKTDSIVFPEQIETEEETSDERGPIKQNTFSVITESDQQVKFDLSNVDKERVKTLFFSYNSNGDRVNTEVTSFDALYIINNLPMTQVTNVEVWALGFNNIESKKFTYTVKPRPFISTEIAESFEIKIEVEVNTILLTNRSGADAKFFYKIDNNLNYTSVNIPSQSSPVEIVINGLSRGTHNITYYVIDNSNRQSSTATKEFIALGYVEISKDGMSGESSSSETGTDISAIIDGDVNTYWQSESSSDYLSHWVDIYFDKIENISGLELRRRANNLIGSFKSFQIEYYSTAASDYVLLDGTFSFNSLDNPATFQRYTFNTINTDYIRIYFREPINPSVSFADLAEINVLEIK